MITRKSQFCPKNWEYILTTIKNQLLDKAFHSQKLRHEEFNKLVEERFNAIEPVYRNLALKVARKFDFKTSEELKKQYLDVPKWIYSK